MCRIGVPGESLNLREQRLPVALRQRSELLDRIASNDQLHAGIVAIGDGVVNVRRE